MAEDMPNIIILLKTLYEIKKINPKELQSFFYNEVCQKVVNADLISNAN